VNPRQIPLEFITSHKPEQRMPPGDRLMDRQVRLAMLRGDFERIAGRGAEQRPAVEDDPIHMQFGQQVVQCRLVLRLVKELAMPYFDRSGEFTRQSLQISCQIFEMMRREAVRKLQERRPEATGCF
jgi:hypothetical protein